MTTTAETKVKSTTPRLAPGMPVAGTIAEVVAAAKRVFTKYHSVSTATYGGGTQVEVRCNRDGYHGRDLKLVATYEITE